MRAVMAAASPTNGARRGHRVLRRLARAAGADELVALTRSAGGRVLVSVVAALALATIVGLATLWSSVAPPASSATDNGRPIRADVLGVTDRACPGLDAPAAGARQLCRTIRVDPVGDLAAGSIVLGPTAGAPSFAAGDQVMVAVVPRPEGVPSDLATDPYSFLGVDRSVQLGWASALLCVLAIAALRARGLLAIAGVALSLLLLVEFLVPAMLAGHAPVLVALVAALAVTFVTLTLTNGVGAQTLASALGISITLLLTVGVGLAAVHATRLDGAGTELSTLLAQARPGLSLEGVLLAGMVIGALGVLADTAVTQASAVMSLRHTDPTLGPGALYRRAVVIGRDHLSATIHTLVLAYSGTALPLLLVLSARDASTLDTINQLDIVEPIVASLVGCAGLIAAVPLTTGLAALLIARISPDALPDGHGHSH